jgi:CRISPR/Cas system CSM-associated protein Csm3 (group 7 of RAMP superfamily)
MKKGIAIDPRSANFIRENGRMRYTKTPLEFMAQMVRHELSLFLGEWFLDENKGLPYLPPTAKKSEHRAILETALRSKLISIEGVKKIIYLTPRYDKRERLYQAAFAVETDAGVVESPVPGEGGIT